MGFRDWRPGARSGEKTARGSSVKPSHLYDNLKLELIGRTREVWQRRLGRDLSREDSRQIVENITGFFSVLAEWSRAELPAPANDNAGAATSEDDGGRHDC